MDIEQYKLSEQQGRFVNEYVVDLNARKAAVRSGYSSSSAVALMANDRILDAIAERKAEITLEYEITLDNSLFGLARMAEQDILDYYEIDEDGKATLNLQNMPPGASKNITDIYNDPKTGETRVRLVNRQFESHKALTQYFKPQEDARANLHLHAGEGSYMKDVERLIKHAEALLEGRTIDVSADTETSVTPIEGGSEEVGDCSE